MIRLVCVFLKLLLITNFKNIKNIILVLYENCSCYPSLVFYVFYVFYKTTVIHVIMMIKNRKRK